ncbi:MAG TPA: response regulator [Gammaproteobacteria bacterium]|nr:response regulator [Gammaproteobacteria bacterium]
MDNKIPISELAITIIEPSSTQARIIGGRLKELEVANTQFFSDGKAALSNIKQCIPDLVISSMYLPDMTGTELVLALRRDIELEAVPYMLISSETSFASLDPIRQAGVVAILPKPFETADLRRALYSTVDLIVPDDQAQSDIALDELNVLVVDDSLMARKHICRVLGNLGIENIKAAVNGSQAVGMIQDEYFDLVVTDYNMPEMDGEQLTRYIRENSAQKSIPVLMVTSEENESRLSAVQNAGVSGICDKPFEPAAVRQMIQNLFT